MTENEKRKFTVFSNTNIPDIDRERDRNKERERDREQEREKERGPVTPPGREFFTNPIYEKLLKYKEEQKKKRFTVEDLLKW